NEWSWTREFTIEADEARKLNREDVMLDSSINWWMVGTIILLILLAITVMITFFKKRKKDIDIHSFINQENDQKD
ncbi:GGIII-like transmembrane region-containing protein, partial [Enterococcus entomosocium]